MAGRGRYEGRSIADLQEISSDEVSLSEAVMSWCQLQYEVVVQSFKLTHLSQLAH